jgi:hypothetical protein
MDLHCFPNWESTHGPFEKESDHARFVTGCGEA